MVGRQRILFGTSNQAKVDHVRALTTDWPLIILSPNELALHIEVSEDGLSAEENACQKASAYATVGAMPAFAIDAALMIEQFPYDQQPGVFVRRIHQDRSDVSDEEILRHYITELAAIGGASEGHWRVAVALAMPGDVIQVESYEVRTRFVMQASPIQIPGAPLSSLMLDPTTNRYYAEMSYAERPDSILLCTTLRKLLQYS